MVTSLIFLAVLTVLAIMSMNGALFGEKISGNERDMLLAREAAELALRDAERDILGQRFDGALCALNTASSCGGNLRPAGTRTPSAAEAGNFQIPANGLLDTVSSAARPATGSLGNTGIYSSDAVNACGKAIWLAADWESDSPPTTKRCTDNSSIVRTVVYGEFTGAPNTFAGGVRVPRYLVEAFAAKELMPLSSSNKVYYRITAVGFGRLSNDAGSLTSVTLQSVYAP